MLLLAVAGRDLGAFRMLYDRRIAWLTEVGFPCGFTAFVFVEYIALLKEWTQPWRRGGDVMTTTLTPPFLPQADACRAMFVALAAWETRRFALNPVFLLAVALTAYTLWSGQRRMVTEIDEKTRSRLSFLAGSACWPRSG